MGRIHLAVAFAAGLVGGLIGGNVPTLLHAASGVIDHSKPVSIIGGRDAYRPALNVISHVGMASGDRIAGVVFHNYTNGPGLQIDQVGKGSGLIIKQANNPREMPESGGKTSNAAFLQMTRAADGDVPPHTIAYFDRGGNLVYENDAPRQKVRKIEARRAALALQAGEGKAIILRNTPQLPTVDGPGARENVLGILPTGQLALWQDGEWRPLAFADGAAVELAN